MLRPLIRRLSSPRIIGQDVIQKWATTTRRTNGGASSFSTLKIQTQHDNVDDKKNDRLLVIGSGVAGSAAALIAAETYQVPVTMLFAGNVATDCNSYWAQGGIIYRNYDSKSNDSADLLAADIHRAGAGLCVDNAVQKVATEGPSRVRQLLLAQEEAEQQRRDAGTSDSASASSAAFATVPFDRCETTGQLALCLEASHAAPRILHKADHTGKTITQHITAAAARHPLITQQAHTVVTELLVSSENENDSRVCVGVETLDRTTGQRSAEYATHGTVLAAGGLAGIYQHSTNPAGFNALGSSVALAVRAGAAVQDLEFVQFHPTALYIPNEARFLLTEALRGEGGILRNAAGRAFAKDYHADGELAPRDVVARAVFEESQKTTDPEKHNVFLDITHRDGDWLHRRFPSIQQHLQQRGLDLAVDRLPVIPAAHYTCGGITTDLHGRTNVTGLYAAGEAARTGLHGGNRLASTSLLEGLVFGAAVADFVGASKEGAAARDLARNCLASGTSTSLQQQQEELQAQYHPYHRNYRTAAAAALEPVHIENAAHHAMRLLSTLRRTMWDYVGVARTRSGLQTALETLDDLQTKTAELYATCPTLETAAVRDAACAGHAVTQAALANPTSAGAHHMVAEDVTESDLDEDDEDEMAVAAAP